MEKGLKNEMIPLSLLENINANILTMILYNMCHRPEIVLFDFHFVNLGLIAQEKKM